MPNSDQLKEPLVVSDFTNSVKSIVDLLKDKYPPGKDSADVGSSFKKPSTWRRGGLIISDVVDNNGNQYVDLVQEGGGVHGIALAGYTYILEKMGTAFSKMAGTSAGSINTMLLSAVTTKDELKWMQQKRQANKERAKAWETDLQYKPELLDLDKYYETRSEKVLEYLSAKNLSDLVDGHPKWRKLILETFRGRVKFDNIKSYFRKIKSWGLTIGLALIVLLASGIFMLFVTSLSLSFTISKVLYGVGLVIFMIGIIILLKEIKSVRFLYFNAHRFGINPEDEFEKWIQTCLEDNGINNTGQLKNKMQVEQECLQFRYRPWSNNEEIFTLEGNDSVDYAETKRLKEELAGIVKNFSSNKKVPGSAKADQIELTELLNDELGQLNWKIVNTAKKISPDDPRKSELAKALVDILVEINKFKSRIFEHGEDEGDATVAYKKEIAIVSSDISNEMKAEFPAMHKMYWGENIRVSPAKYVRASMAIPGFFKPFRIDYDPSQKRIMEKEWKELLNIELRLGDQDTHALLVDGGLLSNFPVNIFFNNDSPLPSKPTVGVKLEFDDDASQNQIGTEMQMMAAIVSTMRYFYDRDFMSKHNMFKKTVRSIDTGEIHWLNFDLTDKEKIELFFRGALTAAIFLLGFENENEKANKVQQLIQLGKNVSYKNTSFSIFKNDNIPTFLTEDNLEDVSFNWEHYKIERILMLCEQNKTRSMLKRKAAYLVEPPVSDNDTIKAQ